MEQGYYAINEDSPLLENGPRKTGTNVVQVYFMLVNAFIGGGILGLPYGFKEAGLITGVVLLIILAVISDYTAQTIVACKVNYHKSTNYIPTHTISTYTDIGHACFGRLGAVLVDISVVMSQFGFGCVYLVFISTNVHSIVSRLSQIEVLAIMLPVLILLVWLRDLKFLSFTSLFANVAVVATVVCVLQYGFTQKGILPLHEYAPFVRPKTLPIFYGIVAFGYCAHGLMLDVQGAMKEPAKFGTCLNFAMTFVAVIYVGFGGLGYLFFGENTCQSITQNLGHGIEADIIKMTLSTVLLFAYPIQMFPAVKNFRRLFVWWSCAPLCR